MMIATIKISYTMPNGTVSRSFQKRGAVVAAGWTIFHFDYRLISKNALLARRRSCCLLSSPISILWVDGMLLEAGEPVLGNF